MQLGKSYSRHLGTLSDDLGVRSHKKRLCVSNRTPLVRQYWYRRPAQSLISQLACEHEDEKNRQPIP